MRKFLFKRKPLSLTLAITLLTLCLAGVAFSQAFTRTANQFVPFVQGVFVPCANGGAGEVVLVEGTLHILDHITVNGKRVSVKVNFQPQGASGVGQVTGDVYHATGVTQQHDSLPLIDGTANFTFINNFRLIGPGPDNNLQVHQTLHVTVNANGDVTTIVDNASIDCN